MENTEIKLNEYRKKAFQIHDALIFLYILFAGLIAFTSGKYALVFCIPLLMHVIGSFGLRKNKKWARGYSIFVGIIILIGFPIGTICGVGLLYYLFKDEWKS